MNDNLHILIVEDTPIAQKVITIHMTNEGCTVDIASDGVEALQKSMQTHYDAILMDIGLGEGPDGFEVTMQIKQQSELNKNTPIMAVTAHGEPKYQTKAIEYGMVDYFNKPFSRTDAEVIVSRLRS